MKRAKTKHIETRLLEHLHPAGPRWSTWSWRIEFAQGGGNWIVFSRLDRRYTRRSDAKRGAARAWARIQREGR